MSVARVHKRDDRAAVHNIQVPTLQYKTLFTEIADRNREFIWPTREADKVEVVFEYSPTRHCYKNKNWRVLVALGSTLRCGIPSNGNRTFGAGVLRNEGTNAWNQRRVGKLGAWHRASSEGIDNGQGNDSDSDSDMDYSTPIGFQSDGFLDPDHGKAQTQQTLRRVCEESYEVMKCFEEESVSTLVWSVHSPSSCVQGAQSNRASIPAQTEHAILDNSIDELQQISSAMQMLSKRVSASFVQIFSTGYTSSGEREHRNTDLLSRGLTSESGIIIGSDGWVVTNAHVVQGGRRIRIRLNQAAILPAEQNQELRLVFDANLVVSDRDTDLALVNIDATDLPTLELSDSNNLKPGAIGTSLWQSFGSG